MKKPDAIAHMTVYGFVYGLVLGMLYISCFFTVLMWEREFLQIEIFIMIIGIPYLGFFLGGLPGACFGFIDGWVLRLMTRHLEPYLPSDNYGKLRIRALTGVGAVTLIGITLLVFSLIKLAVMVDGLIEISSMAWFSAPIAIAVPTSIYAVHRYFLKLRAWGNVGKAKNKAKHGLTNQLAYEDNAEAEEYLADEGVIQQQKKG